MSNICRLASGIVQKRKGGKHQAWSRYWCLHEGNDFFCQKCVFHIWLPSPAAFLYIVEQIVAFQTKDW